MSQITVSQVRRYRNYRATSGVSNGTVNIEISTLSGVFREQLEQGTIEMNPCAMVPRLPGTQRDTYISWDDFQQMTDVALWLTPIITLRHTLGCVRPKRSTLFGPRRNFSRRMIALPPSRTKEGTNEHQKSLRHKRIPMREEVHDLLWSMQHENGNLVKMNGRVFVRRAYPSPVAPRESAGAGDAN